MGLGHLDAVVPRELHDLTPPRVDLLGVGINPQLLCREDFPRPARITRGFVRLSGGCFRRYGFTCWGIHSFALLGLIGVTGRN